MERKSFSTINLSEDIMKAVEAVGYTEMTEIQEKAIPVILSGCDVIGRSGTGTGKTAAFGIPAVQMIEGNPRKPQVIVLSPTRELAMQTANEIVKFSAFKNNIRVATVYGGQSMQLQFRQLKNANIVIGTPGRVMDHMNRGTLKLDETRMLILDEADEMLNMGFIEDIQFILTSVPEERQTLLFSATMPPQIMKLTKQFQKNPALIAVEKNVETLDSIQQFYYNVPQAQKREALNILLQMYGSNRSVVFCNTKAMVDQLVEYLNDSGFKAVGLHGDMKQEVRTQVMNSFKAGKLQVLIATDVAARGIDVEDVKAVFNFDLPQENEYYVHRIGRTGRAGKTGTAHSLVTRGTEIRKLEMIERSLKMKIERSTLPTYDDIMAKKQRHFEKKLITALDAGPDEKWEYTMNNLVAEGYTKEQIIYCLMGMVADKSKKTVPIVTVNAVAERKRERTSPEDRIEGKTCLRVNIGRKQDVAPNHILGAILDETGLSSKAIGRIEIFDSYTNIQTTPEDAALICESMKGKKIRGTAVRFEISDKAFSSRKGSGEPSRKQHSSGRGNNDFHGGAHGGTFKKKKAKKPSYRDITA